MPLPDCGCDSSFLKYPDCAGAGAVQDEVVELAAAVVVEREGPVGGRPQVVAADPIHPAALLVYRRELPGNAYCAPGRDHRIPLSLPVKPGGVVVEVGA